MRQQGIRPSQLKIARRGDTLKLIVISIACSVALILQKNFHLNLSTPLVYLTAPQQLLSKNMSALTSRLSNLNLLNQDSDIQLSELKKRNLLLSQRLNSLLAVEQDNQRLRKLLAVKAQSQTFNTQIAQVIRPSQNRFSKSILIDLGASENIRIGDPVIDEQGVIGQIINVSLTSAEVLLVTNVAMNVPVINYRNGLQAIVEGNRNSLLLQLGDLNAEVLVGDTFHTSGLGNTFPAGIPVGRVFQVLKNDSSSQARLSPSANLTGLNQLLVLHPPRLAPTIGPPDTQPRLNETLTID